MYYDIEKEVGVKVTLPTSNGTWLYEVRDPATGLKCLVKYKGRRFYIFDIQHPYVISGFAVSYKTKLKKANVVFTKYEHKFWFGSVMDRLLKIVILRTKQRYATLLKRALQNIDLDDL